MILWCVRCDRQIELPGQVEGWERLRSSCCDEILSRFPPETRGGLGHAHVGLVPHVPIESMTEAPPPTEPPRTLTRFGWLMHWLVPRYVHWEFRSIGRLKCPGCGELLQRVSR